MRWETHMLAGIGIARRVGIATHASNISVVDQVLEMSTIL